MISLANNKSIILRKSKILDMAYELVNPPLWTADDAETIYRSKVGRNCIVSGHCIVSWCLWS